MLPIEAVRVASLHQSYLEWVKQFDWKDEFVFECVNMGIPCMTAGAIYASVHAMLEKAGVPKQGMPSNHRIDTTQRPPRDDGISSEAVCNKVRMKRKLHVREPEVPIGMWSVHDDVMQMSDVTRGALDGNNADSNYTYTKRIRSMQVDTGTNFTMVRDEHNDRLHNRRNANCEIR